MGLRRHITAIGGGALVVLLAAGCGGVDREADLVAGKQQFVEKCGACHTMARAETTGTSGPNLDEAFHQALKDGFGRGGIESMVADQIEHPARLPRDHPAYMPPDLVEGDAVHDVAAYVAQSVARSGEDTGLLAEAVQEAGGGEPAEAENGVLTIPATARLAYETHDAIAPPGDLEIESPNPSSVPHNIALEGPGGVDEVGEVVQDGGVSKISVTVRDGEYAFYCSVPGHREGGMEGTLVVGE